MPRWLEDRITLAATRHEGGQTRNTTGNVRSQEARDAVVTAGNSTVNDSQEKNSVISRTNGNTKVVSSDNTTTKSGNDSSVRDSATVQADRSTTRTTAEHVDTEAKTTTQTTTSTKIEDEGFAITFTIKVRGGLGQSDSNPPL